MNLPEAFENQLKDPKCALAVNLEASGDCLIIAFGGLNGGLHMPAFEFFNLLKGLPSQQIYVRDLRQCWYHQGVPGYGNTIAELQSGLKELINTSGARRVITLGASSGGYAALLFGLLLEADETHAFSPKTNINPVTRLINQDLIQKRKGLRLFFSPQAQRNVFDIKKLLDRNQHPTRLHIHYGEQHLSDVKHAERIAEDPRVQLHPYTYDQHNIAAHLRDQGVLNTIVENASRATSLDKSPENRF